MSGWVALSVLACGGGAAVIRYLVSRALPVRPGHIPGGVLLVNVTGAMIGGAALGLAERAAISEDLRLIILTGVCGGLTTFSTWSVETLELVDNGRWRAGLVNVGVTLLLGVAACAVAYLLVR
ncbi:fluoride efflux transporter CrcB [Cryobacterium sp. Sr8]|uniref:fluoride efflux transporter CrcB n=1 Tax=Cryobacterium sp. Sr8 TaxID=1259203 RepID=UPI00141B7406|nr:fluoride efflux transporter CrcB [Cryobacterium sp. Sr8]